MKTKTKIIIVLAALCAGTLTLAACGENPHTQNAERGYNVSVRWDTNGGTVETKEDTYIVDDYKYEDVSSGNGLRLFAPDSEKRGEYKKNVARSGYFLSGWFRERTLRTNEQGEPLDMYGDLCTEQPVLDRYGDPVLDENGDPRTELRSEAGYPQGYMYSGRWDFDNDRLDAEELGEFEYREGEYALTLYAGWVPEFEYDIYGKVREFECESCGAVYYVYKPAYCTNLVKDESTSSNVECRGTLKDNGESWRVVANKSYDPSKLDEEIPIPTWETQNAEGVTVPGCTLGYGEFPTPTDAYPLTFLSVYGTQEAAESGTGALDKITETGKLDEATGTATDCIAKYYARWEEGIWYRLYTEADAAVVAAEPKQHACYDVMADLDFAETEWPKAFSTGSLNGKLRGNGHTLSNVTIKQNGSDKEGLFGTIEAGAVIENINLLDITFRLETASRMAGSMYGLLAGELSRSATFTSVKLTGTFIVGSEVYVPRGRYDSDTGTMLPAPHVYDVGLLSGNFELGGFSLADIELQVEEGRKATIKDPATGELEIAE